MRKIFIGMILVFLDFFIGGGVARIELLPDFVGYILMISGLDDLAEQSPRFGKAKPVAAVMAVYTCILFVLDLIGMSISVDWFLYWLLGLVSTAASLYISYNIVIGVRDIEIASGRDLNGASLYSTWRVHAILSLAIYFLYLIPGLNIVTIIAGFIVAVVYLIVFYTTVKAYYSA